MRYIQHPETLELVPAEDYVRPAPMGRGPNIQPDISPYESIITGETITSRSHHREHLRAHNMVEVGNEAPSWIRERQYERKHGRGKHEH